jgi:uncharacterized DUF497 family protein
VKVSWDAAKNLANQKRHDLSFEEAKALFESGDYLEIFDEEHSEIEERFIAIGLIVRGLILVVWTPSEEDTAHIISARFAMKREQRLFESYMGRRHD